MTPAIIIIAYNRPHSLKRLLYSIQKAKYPKTNIPLCICIDYSDDKENNKTVDVAKAFNWAHGEKKIIHQKENLGLKAHVLLSGDLVKEFDSIIMLEDDLFVSPYFYSYASQSLEFFKEDENIAGISLYNHTLNINNFLPFTPFEDGSSNYFLQLTSSWGQAWTNKQWCGFRDWFNKTPEIEENLNVPTTIIKWPSSSWLKHAIAYLIAKDKYFVYPRISYSTNFSDSGTHVQRSNTFFQVPLQWEDCTFLFKTLSESSSVYDTYFEIKASILKKHNESLRGYKDLEVDLYGSKNYDFVTSEYLISSRKSTSKILSFGLLMKPQEVNIINNIPGIYFTLDKSENFLPLEKDHLKNESVFNYFFGLIPNKIKIQNLLTIYYNRIKQIFNQI